MKRDPGTPGIALVVATGRRACLCVAFGVLIAHPASAAATSGPAPTLQSSVVQYVGSGGVQLSGPLGIAIDTAGREVVLANTGGRRLEFYDFRGRPRGSVAHPVPDEKGRLIDGQPRAVAVDARGDLYVSDIAVPYVDHLDFRGRPLGRIALPAPDDRLDTGGAGALALAADGRLFVASRGRTGRVYVFDPQGGAIAAWGESGRKPGQLSAISGLAVLGDSLVVVSCFDTELGLQVFDTQGHYRRGFGVHDIGMGRFSAPSAAAVTRDGRIWVADGVRDNLQVFDATGTYEGAIDGGNDAGRWLSPSALAADGHGFFAMAEVSGNRLRLLWMQPPPTPTNGETVSGK